MLGCGLLARRVAMTSYGILLPKVMAGTNAAGPAPEARTTQLIRFLWLLSASATASKADLPPPYTVTLSTDADSNRAMLDPMSLLWITGAPKEDESKFGT